MHKSSLLKSRTVAVVTGAVVVVGLGTTSGYAAAQITSAQIADNTIQSRDIREGGVGSNEVADGTLRPRDLGTTLAEQIAQAGQPGVDGKSAFELAQAGGYDGTLAQWLESLKGANGTNGTNGTNGVDGKSAYELAKAGGYDGSFEEWMLSLKGMDGSDGASAYELWLAQGNTGSVDEFLASLQGADGADGADATYVGENWGVVDRNVIGGGLSELRPGPTAMGGAGLIQPPLGVGSLGIHTSAPTDKAAFGNQVDFAGDSVTDITKLGYSVFTTGENNGLAPNNMPSITLEIDPNLTASTRNYSSLVFAPNNSAANQWTTIDATDDANGAVWGLTGADMPCNINGARCTWSQLQAALNDGGAPATVLTVQITKGRDYAFSGAVDALKINDEVFDFEPFGVQ